MFYASPSPNAELGRVLSEREGAVSRRSRQRAAFWNQSRVQGAAQSPADLRAEKGADLGFGQEHNYPSGLSIQGVEKDGSIFSSLGALGGHCSSLSSIPSGSGGRTSGERRTGTGPWAGGDTRVSVGDGLNLGDARCRNHRCPSPSSWNRDKRLWRACGCPACLH